MAATLLQVYKCEECGMMVEVLHGAGGKLTCCNQPMSLLEENTTDAAKEKHVPVIEKTADGAKVTVGSVAHPMDDAHLIEWIELIAGGEVLRQHLTPNDKPEAIFQTTARDVSARAYCNLHGLWKG